MQLYLLVPLYLDVYWKRRVREHTDPQLYLQASPIHSSDQSRSLPANNIYQHVISIMHSMNTLRTKDSVASRIIRFEVVRSPWMTSWACIFPKDTPIFCASWSNIHHHYQWSHTCHSRIQTPITLINISIVRCLADKQTLLYCNTKDSFHINSRSLQVDKVYRWCIHSTLFALVKASCLLDNAFCCQLLIEIRVSVCLWKSLLGDTTIGCCEKVRQQKDALTTFAWDGMQRFNARLLVLYSFSALFHQMSFLHGVWTEEKKDNAAVNQIRGVYINVTIAIGALYPLYSLFHRSFFTLLYSRILKTAIAISSCAP